MKKDRKTNESRGITLIALIVTIIVLLILSGISIAMLTGQNGILNRAEKANSETKKTEIIERAKLDILEKQLLNEGNITKQDLRIILDNYFTGVPAELPESVAELEALELTSKEGKYKVTVGEIYKGTFSQGTGGTNGLEKGKKVTGSNVEWADDTNEYPAIIPVGFCVVKGAGTIDEGLVISDVENDDMANTKHGNQFVWIPVNDYSKFHLIEGYYDGALDEMLSQETNPSREAGDTLNIAGSPMTKNSTEGTEESVAMYNSVKVNHGFYIARFEAGIEGVIDNYNLSSENEKVADGKTKPLSQKGVGVWNNIAWEGIKSDDLPEDYTANGAVKVARSMYTKSEACGVTSTLCYGVQWDAVMNFIDPKYETGECNTTTSFVANSQGKGNYKENIETTGYYVEKNIYDLAGNVREWTMEVCLTEQQVIRGGGFFNDRDWYYAASVRDTNLPFDAIDSTGFRVALYV
jgi:hypothetical protein